MMFNTRCCLLLAVALLAGCDSQSVETEVGKQTKSEARKETIKKPEWTPELRETLAVGMPSDRESLEYFVRKSKVVLSGILTDRGFDKTNPGNLQVEKVHFGKFQEKTATLRLTGGFVIPKVGEKVIVMLTMQDGKLKLNSYCSSSGVYPYSDDLAKVIEQTLAEKP